MDVFGARRDREDCPPGPEEPRGLVNMSAMTRSIASYGDQLGKGAVAASAAATAAMKNAAVNLQNTAAEQSAAWGVKASPPAEESSDLMDVSTFMGSDEPAPSPREAVEPAPEPAAAQAPSAAATHRAAAERLSSCLPALCVRLLWFFGVRTIVGYFIKDRSVLECFVECSIVECFTAECLVGGASLWRHGAVRGGTGRHRGDTGRHRGDTGRHRGDTGRHGDEKLAGGLVAGASSGAAEPPAPGDEPVVERVVTDRPPGHGSRQCAARLLRLHLDGLEAPEMGTPVMRIMVGDNNLNSRQVYPGDGFFQSASSYDGFCQPPPGCVICVLPAGMQVPPGTVLVPVSTAGEMAGPPQQPWQFVPVQQQQHLAEMCGMATQCGNGTDCAQAPAVPKAWFPLEAQVAGAKAGAEAKAEHQAAAWLPAQGPAVAEPAPEPAAELSPTSSDAERTVRQRSAPAGGAAGASAGTSAAVLLAKRMQIMQARRRERALFGALSVDDSPQRQLSGKSGKAPQLRFLREIEEKKRQLRREGRMAPHAAARSIGRALRKCAYPQLKPKQG
ncbi:unnamed protein product [Prorocentrum cordatum]|uniref:Uncharacterized protein n=1 Tax=Prorocentrum cordatum TaxID=2364126 RepID=A0ABN9THN1_9DINO|nr:unnamed protein product [Polarella glacialis]